MQTSTPKNQTMTDESYDESVLPVSPLGGPGDHTPVLLKEVLYYLDPKSGDSYLDLTAGYGGHAEVVLGRTLNGPAVLVDRDINAVEHLMARFKQDSVSIRHADFLSVSIDLIKQNQAFDLILADLGVSSPHLNIGSRGFSISSNGPLDMRMNQSQKLTADMIVNGYKESELAKIILRYGEEPKAFKIARKIVQNRPLHTTHDLAAVVARAVTSKSKVHPATRVFQALRIAVNDELEQIEQAIPIWVELLKPGGRLVIISFHSLEDRLVKRKFSELGDNTYDATLKILTKKPVVADSKELVFNPRARSAKLRAAVKIKTYKRREE